LTVNTGSVFGGNTAAFGTGAIGLGNGTSLTLGANGSFVNAINVAGGLGATISAGTGLNATLGGNVNLGAGSSLAFGRAGALGGLTLNWGAGSTIGSGARLSADFGTLGLGAGFNGGLLSGAELNVGGTGAFNLNGINTTLGRLTGSG
ncbi:hypothetical protein RNS23_11780, partial [Staphylococcus pseudintermedius]|nr:hypothetical protein [Staphylococcus pseudintermedius]